MRRITIFIWAAVMNLLFNVTAGLVSREMAIQTSRWGWLLFLLHGTYIVVTSKSVRAFFLKVRAQIYSQSMSYTIVALIGAMLGIAYWFGINRVICNEGVTAVQ
jgi:hypothetical protein